MPTDAPQKHDDAGLALEQLCLELFQPDELRSWALRHLSRDVVNALPGTSASNTELIHGFVRVLERHALVDQVTNMLSQHLSERRRMGLGARPPARDPVSRRRHELSRAVMLGLFTIFTLTRGYPSLDISRALILAEQKLFAFLPASYRHLSLPCLIAAAVATTVHFWYASRDSGRRC